MLNIPMHFIQVTAGDECGSNWVQPKKWKVQFPKINGATNL
jgi:hypothetical protein